MVPLTRMSVMLRVVSTITEEDMTSERYENVEPTMSAVRRNTFQHHTERATIARLLIATFSLVSLLAGALMWISNGTPRSPERNGLLFGPSARFSDLHDLIAAGLSGFPYGHVVDGIATAGPSYPPGLFAVTRALGGFSEFSVQRLLIVTTGLAVAVLSGPILCAAYGQRERLIAGTIGFASTLLCALTLDWYCVVLMGAAAVLLLLVAVSFKRERALMVIGLPILLGSSFPIVFALDRMNADILILQLMTVAVYTLRRGHGNVAAIAFGTAIALKIYPVYFAIADFRDRGRVVRLLVAATTGVTITIVGFLTMDYPLSDAIDGFNRSVIYFEQNYIIASSGMPFGASLLSAARILYRGLGHTDVNAFTASIYPAWKMWSPVLLGLLAASTVFLRTAPWCRLMVMTCALLVLSPNTGMYRATMLLVPVAMWMGHLGLMSLRGRSTRLELLLGGIIGIGLAPLTFWEVMGFEPTVNITSQTLLAPFVYLAILVVAMVVGLQERNIIFSRVRRANIDSTKGSSDPPSAS